MTIMSEIEGNQGCLDDIRKLVEEKDVDLKAELTTGQQLLDKVQDMTAQMDDLNTAITSEIRPQLADSTGQLQRATAELAETRHLLQLAERLLQLARQLAAARQLREQSQLAAAAQLAAELRQGALQLADSTDGQVAVVSDLQQRALVEEESVIHELNTSWRSALCWEDGTLSVRAGRLPDTADGLRRLGRLHRHLARLAEDVLERLVQPLLDGGRLEERREGETVTLTAVKPDGGEAGPAPDSSAGCEAAVADVCRVYSALCGLLTRLRDAALTGRLMAEFGALASGPLTDRLVRGPLERAIPASLQRRPQFDQVIQQTERFSAELAALGFWERAGSLLDHVADVDRLMVDRVCADRLAAARRLAAAELHATVPIGHEPPPPEQPEQPAADAELPTSLFRLPRCRVSESAVQLADLVASTVSEAAAAPELLSARLHYTARHVLELYCALLPAAHRRQLDTLPQQAAIAHNDLQYMAHRVTALHVQHRCSDGTLLDMVPELRQTGSDIFLSTLNRMKEQLLEILSEAGLDQLEATQPDGTATDTALRQCLHQLRHVGRVWRPVLPAAVLARSVGLLLAVVSGGLTDRLLSQQDISAAAAAQVAQAARRFADAAHRLFMPEEEEEASAEPPPRPPVSESEARALLVRHTAGWARFREVLIVLEENLRGILDRWSDGKGPLAQHFSADEARHLVRALFQNNERRAAALARIK